MSLDKRLRIGVFIPGGAQLLDMSPVDLFGMLSPDYLRACQLPGPLVALGVPSTIHYIAMPDTGTHIELTASAFLRASKTTLDQEVQPGRLDIVLIPGPDPSKIFEDEVLQFVRAHATWRGDDGKSTDILSVCTGCFILGQSGILKGKSASGPRGVIPMLKKKFPDTKWVDDKRWVKDGNIWTSGKLHNSPWIFFCASCYFACNMPVSKTNNSRNKLTKNRRHNERARDGGGIYQGELPKPSRRSNHSNG
jgi:putative intracellular protease/amidase